MFRSLFLFRLKPIFVTLFVLLTLFSVSLLNPNEVFALTKEEEAVLYAERDALTKEIARDQALLDGLKTNTKSLQQDAAVLNAKIKLAKTQIKARNVAIANLGKDINKKIASIGALEARIDNGHESLAQLLRKTNEIDEFSLPEVILGNKDISDFFIDIDSFQMIKKSLQDLFEEIRDDKETTQKEKEILDKKKDQEIDTKAAVEATKREVEKNEKEKQYLIAVNKTQEKTYAQVIAERQAKVSEINAKLFKFAGGSAAIPFGTALKYAQYASLKTGVTSAFVLAILTQESNLGSNVGQCYLTDATTGAGIGKNTGKTFTNLMKATRDVEPFLAITSKLGFDAFKTVVSCPIAGVAGYGGAMGPAQFIPSTWKIFENRLTETLGRDPNPWNPEDAFMASAMYLSDLGAKTGTYSGELRAACKYYGSGGSTCSYGRSVMGLKSKIQADIDYLLDYGVSRR